MKKVPFLFVVILVLNLGATQISVPKDAATIQAAIDKAEPGDTVYVSDGIYRESITMKDSVSIIGQSAQGTVIKGKRREPVVKAGDKCIIEKLTITHGSKGILCENVIPSIRNCIIRDNKGTGIHCLVTLPDICNNLIFNNEWTGIFCESTRSIKTSIMHNVIAENHYCGIRLSGSSEVLIQNNVIIDNMQYGIYADEASKKSRIVYNNFYNNRTTRNYFALVDKSNTNEEVQYPVTEKSGKRYFDYTPENLKGKGKDGSTIGIINNNELNQVMNDPDMDGVSNEKDQCRDIAEDIDKFQDEDGCPDFDNDKDGIFDNADLCPDSAEDFDNFHDDDGCPDSDNDKDGIVDEKDLCPNNAETKNSYKDDDGCPDEVPAGSFNNSVQPDNAVSKESVSADSLKAVKSADSTVVKGSQVTDSTKNSSPVNK